jgi:drug/metabolite transporter (DMT)-like permease
VAVVLALLADAVFGVGVALQQRAAMAVPRDQALRLGLLTRLVRNPMWLAGLAAEIGGFALHAAALANGSLALVQPLLTLDLVFTLAICAAWTRSPLTARDWLGVGLTIVGISLFLVLASPTTESTAVAAADAWILCSAVVATAAAVVAVLAARAAGVRRAALLAVAAGIANGFMAVLTKAFADRLGGHGVLATLRSWEPYAVVVAGVLAMVLIQSAYQAGHATIVLPTINVVDPIVSVLVAVVLFDESIRTGQGRVVGVVAALGLAVSGLALLGRNPLVQPEQARAVAAST